MPCSKVMNGWLCFRRWAAAEACSSPPPSASASSAAPASTARPHTVASVSGAHCRVCAALPDASSMKSAMPEAVRVLPLVATGPWNGSESRLRREKIPRHRCNSRLIKGAPKVRYIQLISIRISGFMRGLLLSLAQVEDRPGYGRSRVWCRGFRPNTGPLDGLRPQPALPGESGRGKTRGHRTDPFNRRSEPFSFLTFSSGIPCCLSCYRSRPGRALPDWDRIRFPPVRTQACRKSFLSNSRKRLPRDSPNCGKNSTGISGTWPET